MSEYRPKIGDRVDAARKVKLPGVPNRVFGPVTAVYEGFCLVHNNPGGWIEKIWSLSYSDWTLTFVFHEED
jgi:hypothetical protein